jgi:thioredoxin-related protein
MVSQVVALTAPPAWTSDYAQALEKARQTQCPLVVVLEDRTDPHSTLTALDDPDVQLALRNCSVCRVDVGTTEGANLAKKFGSTELPYTAVSDRAGKRIVLRAAGEYKDQEWIKLLASKLELPTPSLTASEHEPAPKAGVAPQKLELVVLSTKGCFYCEKLKQESISDPQVQAQLDRKFDVKFVDASVDGSLAQEHHVQIYPATLVLDEKGELMDRIDGFIEAPQLAARLGACRERQLQSVH